ncbi:MAG TPA: ribosome assembly RNA-binding protein YhbY [Rudaea sp.]
MPLKPAQKRYLRGLAHALNPVVLLGNKGVTEAVVKEMSIALDRHELVKVKLSGADKDERGAQIEELAKTTGAETVQSIGKVATFYRRNAEEPKLMLPK